MESITSNSQTEQTVDSSQLARRRKIFGMCKGCSQPNTNFNECDACETWVKQQQTKLLELQNEIDDRKNRINQQTCSNCDQPKHVHHHIAACGECGYPEMKIEDLYEFAICFLQCPDYTEVVERIRLELNEMKYDDPDYRKLVEVKERYDNLVQQQQDEEDHNTSIDRNIKMSQIGLNSLLRSSAMKVQF
ncbi:13217_t:CDS:2 [Gigaspora margarita]|uniref:13217_t:CDS:1 n=1 Tax=Gigaspora margarita TaxID=4874 RepID=A0ABN7VDS8_GIGMA|nr:13217_t:CDS:2 [Gigaspora margarita]